MTFPIVIAKKRNIGQRVYGTAELKMVGEHKKERRKNKKRKEENVTVEQLQREVEETKIIVRVNCENIINVNNVKLEEMLSISDNLEKSADKFATQTNKLKKKFRFKAKWPCLYFCCGPCYKCCCNN